MNEFKSPILEPRPVSDVLRVALRSVGDAAVATSEPVVEPLYLEPSEFLVLLERRRERDQRTDRTVFTGFDICYPDGRPVSVGLRRFCNYGTRLLVGRGHDIDRALVGITLYPVGGLEAELTRPGRGARCRRFYALRGEEGIRLHFFNGMPTEILFDDRLDDPAVLHWLRADYIRPNTPFWFDLASQFKGSCTAMSASQTASHRHETEAGQAAVRA